MSARSVEISAAAIAATDVSHSTDRAAEIFASYFGAKSAHDAGGFMGHFSRRRTTYADATLGWNLPTWEAQADVVNEYMPNWGDGVSYATRILGDERSAVLFVTASPEILGNDIRGISGVDLDEDGKITRFIDYWDGRHFGAVAAARIRVSPDDFPQTFGEEAVASQAGPRMWQVVEDLGGALAATDADRAAALFATDAFLEDMALRTRVRGRPAIGRYLGRADGALPYAAGASVRHVMGNELGGGYEWRNDQDEAARGIVALALDPSGLIGGFTTVWDGTLVGDERLSSLATLALEL